MNKWRYSAVHNYTYKVIQTQTICRVWLPGSVIPLPHQIRALSRAISNDPSSPKGLRRTGWIPYLLADEVGLGKTIEAGLIMLEFKLCARNGNDEVKSWFVEIESKTNVEVFHV